MPCLLKIPQHDQPGVIVFTHNEYLFGGLKTANAQKILQEHHGKWRFGIHIQGNCHFLKSWPDQPWLDFILWPEKEDHYLHNVKHKVLPFNCVSFYPAMENKPQKKIDICIGSRPIKSKNFEYSLQLIKEVLRKRPETTVLFLTPDDRQTTLKALLTGRNKNLLLEKCLSMFSSSEMRNISFIASSIHTFGLFPMAAELYWDLVASCRTSLLTSLSEGTPRIVVESIIYQTRPIIMNDLISGLSEINRFDSVILLNNDHQDVEKIIAAIENNSLPFSYEEQKRFSFSENWPVFKERLSEILHTALDDKWFNHDLTNRLAGHLQKRNFQLMDAREIKTWLQRTFSGHIDPEELV